ncbi:hypothetical protein DFH29DRAFT_1002376 [Suillus ampliporus]|nr:hypothetical protein DFH29DRAFT_1002376 [Suillus ampliporus]
MSNQEEPALSAVGKGSSGVVQLEDPMEDIDEDLSAGDEDSDDKGKKKKGQKNAQLLKTAIVDAHKNLSGAITAKADGCNQPHASILNQKATPYHDMPNVPEDSDELVGGFGDEDLDDELECAVALSTQGKVVSRKSTIKITSCDIDPDLVPPPLAQPPSSRVTSAMKRKQMADLILGLSKEDELLTPQEDDNNIIEVLTSDEEAMQVDKTEAEMMEKPIAVKVQQATTVKASRTTAATSEILKVVYPNIWYKVVTSGLVFGVVTQCLSEWPSNFGSTALTMVIDFLNSNRDTPPQILTKLLLSKYAFLYPDPENINKDETFHSAFAQELLATAHLSRGITGALGLYAVSLECAFTLVAKNTVTVDDPEAPTSGQKAHLKMPKTFNKVTGKEMTTEHVFSVAKWGLKTASFIQGANKKGAESIQLTMSMAYKYLKKPGFNNHNSADSVDEMDDCADIWCAILYLCQSSY